MKKLRSLNYNPEKLYYIPFGVDIEVFNPNVKPMEKFENSILFVGSLAPFKGIEILLKAFEKVQNEIPKAKLLIIRAPKPKFKYIEDKIRLLINKGFNIEYIGFVKNYLLPIYYRAVDIFVLLHSMSHLVE